MKSIEKKALNAKDLINVGIYTALYLAIFFAVGLLTAIPVIYPVLFLIWPIVTGVPFMLFATKIKKKGMVFISAMIVGLSWFLMGYPWTVLITYFIFGILSELAFSAGNYNKFSHVVVGYWLFSMATIGIQLPIWFMDGYMDGVKEMMGEQYASQLAMFMPKWMLLGGIVLLFIGSVIGANMGRKMLRKHFERAGIA
jgi:energy-coupling factor transport system substrate-specific component